MKTQKQTDFFFTEFHSKVTILTEPAVSSVLQLWSQLWSCTGFLLKSILSCLPTFSLVLLQFYHATLSQNTCKKGDVLHLSLTSDGMVSELCYIRSPLSCSFAGSPALCVCDPKGAVQSLAHSSLQQMCTLRDSLVSSVNFIQETAKD